MTRRAVCACALAAAFILLFFGACRVEVKPAATPTPTPTRAVMARRGALAVPAAPAVDYARTRVIPHFEGSAAYTMTTGSAAWGDLHLYWRHPDPVSVTYYEVYTTTDVPYFTVPVSATLALTTTAQRAVLLESPGRFNPIPQPGDSIARSALDFYAIRAVNAGGISEPSQTIGAMIYSLIVAPADEPPPNWPTPLPTAGPSPTPVPTLTPTPVPTGTPGPSPTP